MAQRKAQFLTKLGDLLADRNEISGGDFLKMTFFFCRDCNQEKIEPSSLFTKKERAKTYQELIDSFPLLKRDMHHVTKLGWESAMYLRLVRSGLEFIRESFAVDNAWLEHELDEMMDCGEIKSLDRLLESFEGMRGEYDFGDDCVDLREVPESHTWWCNDERADSIIRFGS